jgi:DNA-binding CsgD family transcriptional regulator
MKASGLALDALVAAISGKGSVAHEQASAAIGTSDEAFVVAVATWARGLEALGAGRHEEARLRLQELFASGSSAYHFEVSRWAIADLAEAAEHTGDPGGVAALVGRAEERAMAGTSPRATLLVRRAKALLAAGGTDELLFKEAVATDGADEWPFELARTRFAYGERLRRRRRIVEARTWLRSALDTFDQLGAKPWADRARTELRAAGVVMEGKPPQAIDDLTPQQMQIVKLAARGLSNRDIADKLFLSPRTVGFHLYNAFPKLQVTARAQLADVLGRAPS